MKNIIASVVAIAAFSGASAFATEITPGTPIQPGNQGCELLAEAVTVNLSSNVYAAYSCSTANNTIRVATCHKGGSRKQATIACAAVDVITEDDGSTTTVYNDDSCDGTADQTFTSSSLGKGYQASTAGGSVAATNLGAVCDSAGPVDTLLQ